MKLSSAPEAIINALQNCIKRFPVAVAFITALTLFLIFLIIDEEKTLSGQANGTIVYYLSVGYLLSLTLRLWAEDGRKQRTVLIVNIVAHLLLLADAFYIYHTTGDERQTNWELYVAHAATILSLWLSLFFLSFFKERDNIASWNFTKRLILNSIICYFIGNVLSGGFVLLLTSFNFLFNIDLGYKWMLIAETLIGMLLPTLLFLGRIPQGEQKFDRKPLDSNFLNAVIRYLFLGLEGLYIIVLYIYATLILIRWELPNGKVSMLVVVSMVTRMHVLLTSNLAKALPFGRLISPKEPIIWATLKSSMPTTRCCRLPALALLPAVLTGCISSAPAMLPPPQS